METACARPLHVADTLGDRGARFNELLGQAASVDGVVGLPCVPFVRETVRSLENHGVDAGPTGAKQSVNMVVGCALPIPFGHGVGRGAR